MRKQALTPPTLKEHAGPVRPKTKLTQKNKAAWDLEKASLEGRKLRKRSNMIQINSV